MNENMNPLKLPTVNDGVSRRGERDMEEKTQLIDVSQITLYPVGFGCISYFPTMPKSEYRKRFKEAWKSGGPNAVEEFVNREARKYDKLTLDKDMFKDPLNYNPAGKSGIYGNYGFPTLLNTWFIKIKVPKEFQHIWGSMAMVDPEDLIKAGFSLRRTKSGRYVDTSIPPKPKGSGILEEVL